MDEAPMSDDLVTWLRAQLDDDEQSIRTWGSACVHIDACDDTGDFMERFGEDRMLAEVDAKRRILDEHYGGVTEGYCSVCCEGLWERIAIYLPCPTVKLLALPFADREGFREEWRP